MANNNAKKVIAGKPVPVSGGVRVGPLGTTLPTTANGTIDAALVGAGYVANAGLTKTESRESRVTNDWGGLPIKRTQTSFGVQLSFAFLEYLNEEGAKAIYGDDAVTVAAATSTHGEQINIAVSGKEAPHKTWLFDMADGDAILRIAVPDGQVTAVGDTTYSTSDDALRQVTIDCFPDEDGNYYYELGDDGVKTSGGGGS
ncbi:hypothetical protein [Microbacterium aurantiacum]|uniref:phage tail tube protein n=1 Tax=Microbacterium aurantiacum TaxID=162393 RepID=UPI003417D93D